MDRKMKILWVSDLVAPTGFGRVSHSILKYISDRADVQGLGINYKGDPHNLNFKVFPTGQNGDVFGLSRLQEFVSWKPDVIFILNDVWVISNYLDVIKKVFKDSMPKIVCYFPVDASEHMDAWYRDFDIVTVPVTYTQFGRGVVLEASPTLEDRLKVIPHGVDSDVFYQIGKSRKFARQALFPKVKELENAFIFLNAMRNQPRKRLDITLEAFSIFAKDKPENVRLYMHCGAVDSSMDVPRLASRFGIDTRLILTSVIRGIQRVPEDRLNLIYNACDVGLNTSMGEGWGLPSMEHAVTGAPQIVGEHSAGVELFADCGLLVKPCYNFRFDNIMTCGKLLAPVDVAEAMEKIYSNKELYDTLATASTEKFSRPEYQWSNIAEQWWSIFQEVTQDAPNLAERTA
jgi:glycosyltransferase involved in cell wall biosynthesis